MTFAQQTSQLSNRFSMPALLLRAEGLALFAASLGLYAYIGYSWLAFAAFLLTPDLTFIVFAISKNAGSVAYNLAHFHGFPALLGLLAIVTGSPLALQIALIWFAHIAMDRVVGYGFKYLGNFKLTHLQQV
jgi:Domain of unknown function (DUF4260)